MLLILGSESDENYGHNQYRIGVFDGDDPFIDMVVSDEGRVAVVHCVFALSDTAFTTVSLVISVQDASDINGLLGPTIECDVKCLEAGLPVAQKDRDVETEVTGTICFISLNECFQSNVCFRFQCLPRLRF